MNPIATNKIIDRTFKCAEVFCQDDSNKVEYLCVVHNELCCTKCVCKNHGKCTHIDDIEEAAESFSKSAKLESLSKEIFQHDDTLVKTKSE